MLPWLTIAEAKAGQSLVHSQMVSLDQGKYLQLSFDKFAGSHYEICVYPSVGDADLYTDYIPWPTPMKHQHASANPGLAGDCVDFWADYDGHYFISIYGFTATEFVFYITED